MKAMNAKHYVQYKDKQLAINRENKRIIREKVRFLKEANPCGCGESAVCCLDFHHIGKKSDTISRMLSNTYSWERLEAELRKCCVLCANCHRKHHAGEKLKFKCVPILL
jgi:hypothetical protein